MDVVIAGGHGQIALRLSTLLTGQGHTVRSIVRNPDHTDDVAATGASPVVADLEKISATDLAGHLTGADAVVFAAGAGPGSGVERKETVDRDGAVLLGWTGDNGDPDNFLAVLLGCDAVGGANRAQWCNEEFNDLIMKAKSGSQEERAKLYEEAQVVFKREAPWATIAHSIVHMPMRSNVTGYKMDPLGGHNFEGVDIAE